MRRDIQLLRGIAVLVVVLYHASVGIFNQGFLGVDVFFVVSGFLITTIILKGLNRNDFSFSQFYLRRARRLLPALYCTLSATTILAYLFITNSQKTDFLYQLFGSLTFTSNFVLPIQVGYFESSAESKPLLHIWSLSLEEQYYFFLPVFLFAIPRKLRLPALASITLASLILCFVLVSNGDHPAPYMWRYSEATLAEWAFFLFPTRAWELLAGSLCAWLMLSRPDFKVSSKIKVASVAAIVALCTISIDPVVHPRGDALLIVFATSLIVLGRGEWLPQWWPIKLIERVGDWSYSIYLVHWPLFSFAYLGYLELVPNVIKILLIGASIFLGYVQYTYVERPFRSQISLQPRAAWIGFSTSTLALLVLTGPMISGGFGEQKDLDDALSTRAVNFGLSKDCDGSILEHSVKASCMTGREPNIAIWGDSYAMHLVPGIATIHENIVQLTKSVCGPAIGIAPISGRYGKDWAEECTAFNNLALEYILNSESITHVILSSSFNQYFKAQDDDSFLVDGDVVAKSPALAVNAFVQTIAMLQSANKIPVLVSPPPRSGFNVGECLERTDSNLVILRSDCQILRSEYVTFDQEIIEAIEVIEQETKVRVIWLHDTLCGNVSCESLIHGVYVYRDSGHLSIAGSKALVPRLKLI
ncbi:acyltransferase family protein [Haliea sp.]